MIISAIDKIFAKTENTQNVINRTMCGCLCGSQLLSDVIKYNKK